MKDTNINIDMFETILGGPSKFHFHKPLAINPFIVFQLNLVIMKLIVHEIAKIHTSSHLALQANWTFR